MICAGCNYELEVGDLYITDTSSGFAKTDADPDVDSIVAAVLGGVGDCRNHGCVNPAHLEAVSCRENVLRGVGPTALNARKTHCVHGHEFTTENTQVRVRRDGGRERVCSRCRVERSAVGRARYADNLATA